MNPTLASITSPSGLLLLLPAFLLGLVLAWFLFNRWCALRTAGAQQLQLNRKLNHLLGEHARLSGGAPWKFGVAPPVATATPADTGTETAPPPTAEESQTEADTYDWHAKGTAKTPAETSQALSATPAEAEALAATDAVQATDTTASSAEPDIKEPDIKEPDTTKTSSKATSPSSPVTKSGADTEAELPPLDTTSRSPEAYEALRQRDFSGENVRVDPDLGILYRDVPSVDDLRLIKGVGPGLQDKLNQSGVYRFKQIAIWDKHNVGAFSHKLKTFKGRIARDRWVSQARSLADLASAEERETFLAPLSVDHNAKLLADFTGEDVRIDRELGIIYNQPPALQDDLQAINGVGPTMAEQLNESGVYRYKQLASWSDRNVEAFAGRLDTFKDRIERDKWIPQARRLHAERFRISNWDASAPSDEEYEALIKKAYAGQDVRIQPRLGVVYKKPPVHTDDLTVLPGVDAAMARKLNGLGIYRALQISHWSEDATSSLAQQLGVSKDLLYAWVDRASLGLPEAGQPETAPSEGTPPETRPAASRSSTTRKKPEQTAAPTPKTAKKKVPAAFKAAAKQFKGEAVEVDAKLGVLYTDRPDSVDKLTQIKGVGKVINEKLNAYGVYRWKQIGLWTRDQADAFAEELATFQDRIHRDKWVEQAKALHREHYGESL